MGARDEERLEQKIAELLADSQYEDHVLRAPLAELFERYSNHVSDLERLTSISDGYQAVMRDHNHSLTKRYRKQVRQLQKIVRISDHYQVMLQELNDQLKTISLQDSLTGLANRRAMIERLQAEVAAAARHNNSFSVGIIDIDHFKKVNDSHGHDAGDHILVCVTRAISAALRAEDVCARWGGEEFLVMWPQTSVEEATSSAQRLCAAVSAVEASGISETLQLSVSIGVAEHRATSTLDETIKCADIALYDAKREGRNRVAVADQGTHDSIT